MGPLVFASMPWIFNFAAVVLVLQWCIILLGTGKRYFKQVAVATVALAGGVIGQTAALTYQQPGYVGIAAGVVGGLLLGLLLRPVGVGLSLAYLGYSVTGNIVPVQDAQYLAAVVLFAYGLLLTDLAPTFVSGLLASGMLVLLGQWVGASDSITFGLVMSLAAVRVLATVVPPRLASRGERSNRYSVRGAGGLARNSTG